MRLTGSLVNEGLREFDCKQRFVNPRDRRPGPAIYRADSGRSEAVKVIFRTGVKTALVASRLAAARWQPATVTTI